METLESETKTLMVLNVICLLVTIPKWDAEKKKVNLVNFLSIQYSDVSINIIGCPETSCETGCCTDLLSIFSKDKIYR